MIPREAWLDILRAEQQGDGSFRAWTSPHLFAAKAEQAYATTFVTSQIAWALSRSGMKQTDELLGRAVSFLERQFQDGSVNYWARGSTESERMRLPDDLDDTACALAAFISVRPKLKEDGQLLGQVTRALIDCETQPGGPFRTWRIHHDADAKWLDVDVAVNANVAYALSLLDVSLDPLWTFLDRAVEQWRFHSLYYPNRIPILFFLSRLPRPVWRETLRKAWMDMRSTEGGWGNPFHDSLALVSLKELGVPAVEVEEVRARLLHAPVTGSYAFCLDPAQQGQTFYSGSPALEAAFRLLAFHEEEAHVTERASEPGGLHSVIMRAAQAAISGLGEPLRKQCEALLQRLDGFDIKRQITLTPLILTQALDRAVSEDFLVRLGKANVFGWAAYTALDDILDSDAGPELLSPAVVFLRRMSDEFSSIHPTNIEFQNWWRSIVDRIDVANAHELATMRNLDTHPPLLEPHFFAERSLGHLIAPVALMIECGYALHAKETQSIFEALRWYIAARQLHDDAHDWETDLKRGQYNSASLRLAEPKSENARIEFWTRAVVDQAETIFNACREGRACLRAVPLVHPEGLEALFERIEQGTHEALEGRRHSLDFIKNFSASSSGT